MWIIGMVLTIVSGIVTLVLLAKCYRKNPSDLGGPWI